MANPINIIKKDHRKVEKLFSNYEELGDQTFKTKQEIAMQIINELRLHAEMEEVFFIQLVKRVSIKREMRWLKRLLQNTV